jgi:hypothetical protein
MTLSFQSGFPVLMYLHAPAWTKLLVLFLMSFKEYKLTEPFPPVSIPGSIVLQIVLSVLASIDYKL